MCTFIRITFNYLYLFTKLKQFKIMKRTLTIIGAAALLAIGGCQNYDDSSLWGELDSQAKRIAALGAWQKTVNNNIGALQNIVSALQENDYVTRVEQFSTPLPGGYYIQFNKSPQATILNGENGEKGDKGDTGTIPQVGVKEYPEDSCVYYWTLNNDFLLDDSENKIPVTGSKGVDGITPPPRRCASTPKPINGKYAPPAHAPTTMNGNQPT
jgi:hypothetical protein